jgi:prepilin-type N-terminal cleavage/methylation domain-containing protein
MKKFVIPPSSLMVETSNGSKLLTVNLQTGETMRVRFSAFTLIELLIVVAVIAIIAGMFLSIINMMNTRAKVAKTRSILGAVMLGVSSTSMTSNTSVSTTPHPLANTMTAGAMTRSVFLRGATIAGFCSQFDPVLTTGEALTCNTPTIVASSSGTWGRLMLPTDVYAGNSSYAIGGKNTTDCPLIYGLDRRHLNIIGSGWGMVDYRHLPGLSSIYDPNNTGTLQGDPYTNTGVPSYPDSSFLNIEPGDLTEATQSLYEIDSKKVMDVSLGPDVSTEIGALGGLRTADINTPGSIPIANYRLRLWPVPTGTSFANFAPNNVKDASQVLDGTWKPYHLRGTALYDAWGHEIIYFTNANGSMSLMSAGIDGFFCWNPGADMNYDTQPGSAIPSNDDLDASRDNIFAGTK